MADVLVKGGGLAGMLMVDALAAAGFSVLWDHALVPGNASSAAYGMVNPVHIRNFQLSWRAPELYPLAKAYYQQVQQTVAAPFLRALPIYHVYAQADEAVHWRQAYETTELVQYSTGETQHLHTEYLKAPYGGTILPDALFIRIPDMLAGFMQHLPAHVTCVAPICNIHISDAGIKADNYEADYIVYADGVGLLQNPYFKNIPLRPCKGESILIDAPLPAIPEAIHKKFFLTQEPSGYYRWGSTYAWNDLSPNPTEQGLQELETHLSDFLAVPYQRIAHKAGIRPAVADRRPLVGRHPNHQRVLILNGLGSRGLLLGPWLAHMLVQHIQHNTSIDAAVDVQRFKKRLINDSQ